MEAWHGRDENLKAGQQAFYHRARCNGAAARGEYTDADGGGMMSAGSPARRRERHDD